MGNRAVIQFGKSNDAIGIYLHWNGGRDSVNAFLQVAKDYNCRCDEYAPARLCQIIGNFFGGTLSLGCGLARNMDRDNGDNGTYVIGDNWNILTRLHHNGTEQTHHKLDEMVTAIKEKNNMHFLEKEPA